MFPQKLLRSWNRIVRGLRVHKSCLVSLGTHICDEIQMCKLRPTTVWSSRNFFMEAPPSSGFNQENNIQHPEWDIHVISKGKREQTFCYKVNWISSYKLLHDHYSFELWKSKTKFVQSDIFTLLKPQVYFNVF